MRRAPTLLVSLCAAVVELVVLAAAGNQWIVNHLITHAPANEPVRDRALKATLTAFPWRFTPHNHERMLWLGELVAVVGLIIAVFLLVYAFVSPMRAPRSSGAVLLGTWGIVVTLTQIAAIGATMIAYSDISGQDTGHLGRWWYGVFTGPSAATVVFGIGSGLLVAIVAGITAVTSADDEDLDEVGMPVAHSEVPAWSAALGSTQGVGVPGERTSSWPPPEPPSWSPPEPEPPSWRHPEPEPPSWRHPEPEPPSWPQPWAQPKREPAPERDPEWGSVTESTRVTQALPPQPSPLDEPSSEITNPRRSMSTLPGALPPTGRLPLPEDRPPGTVG